MAAHLRERCPWARFIILERRADLGGTWDLFRYPGIRSDSDMHTLGFGFEPWTEDKAIAGAPAILDYLNRIVDERHIRERIRFSSRVLSANWDPGMAAWQLAVEREDRTESLTARFLYLGSGYYDYDHPHAAKLPGSERFKGQIVHPQFWPEELDYSGKRVVVIGSGATAVTLVPAMAGTAAHVTMLQRTPSWLGMQPSRDKVANAMRKVLPSRLAYALTRAKNIHLQNWLFHRFRRRPDRARRFLHARIRARLGNKFRGADFTPPYDPWDQRLCLVPDGDMFDAMRSGKASIITDKIDTIDEEGVLLMSGRHLPAEVLVTATGLRLAIGGKIAFSLQDRSIELAQHWFYKNCMLSNVPNLAMVFGYLNASWTLRADLVADYVCRVLAEMRARKADVVVPMMRQGEEPQEARLFEMSSGYIERGRHVMPRHAAAAPWQLNQDYLGDRKWMKSAPIDDGILQWRPARLGVIT